MDKIELLSFQFGAGASDWHVTAGMLPRIRVDVDILQTNFAEIDHKQVRSLISELLKDLLAKASDLLARLPIRLAQPVRVVENCVIGFSLYGVAAASAVAFPRAHSAFRCDWERSENQFSRMICAATSSTPACLVILPVSSKICSTAAFEDSLSSIP